MSASNDIDETSRSAAADDDGTDQIGSDTPRSGVATPQPDLHDKRLPGIMSYFNQVRPASFKRLFSDTFTVPLRPSSTSNLPTSSVSTSTFPAMCPTSDCKPEAPEQVLEQPSGQTLAPVSLQTSQVVSSASITSSGADFGVLNPAADQPNLSRPASPSPQEDVDRQTSKLPAQDSPRRNSLEKQRYTEQKPQKPTSLQTPIAHNLSDLSEHAHLSDVLSASKASIHPYPTPPASVRGTMGSGSVGPGRQWEGGGNKKGSADDRTNTSNLWDVPWTFRHKKSISDAPAGHARQDSSSTPLAGVITPSSVLARHFSIPSIPVPPASSSSSTPFTSARSPYMAPGDQHPPTAPDTPVRSQFEQTDTSASSAVFRSASMGQLKRLTTLTRLKSGHSTPIRSLSTAHSQPDSSTATAGVASPMPSGNSTVFDSQNFSHGAGASLSRAPSSTPTPPGAQAPATKGKLTIKIVEARGLRRTRDPYVIAVFQRSELISGGPRPVEAFDESAISALSSIQIQRQGSDSGRPMAIPMRSRQSSNTSTSDFSSFRRSNPNRRSLTNPKWDAEAVYDVVDSDMSVDVSVYDHSAAGEQFLGHVKFQANKHERDGPVCGWFPLRGHADTMAEDAPTGEIHVEAFYQRSDRKHCGPDDFQILRLIGKGTFGQVYQVRKKDTRRIYAMKVLSKKKIVQKKEVAHTVGERNILVRTATSDSPFIVGLKFSFQTPSDLYLVTDYMSGGELFWHLQKEGRFEEARAKFYIAELILAIEHLHNNNIVYRDLKPENILLDANGHIALCDFGLSKANLTKNDTTNTFCGTTEYLAPEVLLDEAGYTKMVDFWSLGVLVFEMCCGWSPFYAEDTQQMYKNIAFGKVRFPKDTLSAEGRSFVKGLLNRNPKHRLGAIKDAAELMEHPFFRDIDWLSLSKKLITPPFKPQLKSDTDVSYFDPAFTDAMDKSGSLNERAAALAQGIATSTPLSPSMQANFQGFTFVDESALDDHMRGRASYNNNDYDDDMHDASRSYSNGGEHGQDDKDWDDLNDIDPRHADRMSGIVRTTTEEQMFGETHFDM